MVHILWSIVLLLRRNDFFLQILFLVLLILDINSSHKGGFSPLIPPHLHSAQCSYIPPFCSSVVTFLTLSSLLLYLSYQQQITDNIFWVPTVIYRLNQDSETSQQRQFQVCHPVKEGLTLIFLKLFPEAKDAIGFSVVVFCWRFLHLYS